MGGLPRLAPLLFLDGSVRDFLAGELAVITGSEDEKKLEFVNYSGNLSIDSLNSGIIKMVWYLCYA